MSQVKLDDASKMYTLTNTPTTIPMTPMAVSIVLVVLESLLLKIPCSMLTIPIINTASPGYVVQIGDTLVILTKRYIAKPIRIPPMMNLIFLTRFSFLNIYHHMIPQLLTHMTSILIFTIDN